MAEPCRQEGKIAALDANDQRLLDALSRLEQNQKRFIEVLEQIAAQGERINHLEGDMRRVEKDTDNLFGRVRTLEIAPVEDGRKVKFGFLNQLMTVAGSVITAFLILKFFGK